jgi:ATP-dependent Clp protease protease subunit
MMHQPLGGARGQVTDIEIQTRELKRIKDTINKILTHHSGQKYEKVVKDTDRDFYMSAQESKEYGLVDEVIKSREEAIKK